MKKITKCSLFLVLVYAVNRVEAQTIVKNDTISGVPMVMTMDARVNDLIEKSEENCLRVSSTGTSTRIDSSDDDVSPRRTTAVRVEKPLSNADVCRQNPRIMGYKIQLAVVKSNEEAKEVGMYFRRRFPNMKVEIDASLRPNYKVMAGSYFTKQSASSDLKKVKQYFKSAIPIQYRVFCVEAK